MHSAIADNETANPRRNRPKRTDVRFVENAMMNAPTINKRAFKMIVSLRPQRSTNIPIDKMD